MPSSTSLLAASLFLLPSLIQAAPGAPHPQITPPPVLRKTPARRDLADDILSYEGSLLSVLGSDIPSYVVSGVPNFFASFPTGDAVLSDLGISTSELAASPTLVLNIPGYANWTDQGWNLRVHGNVYKQPNISESELDDLANNFLVGTSVQSLPPAESSQAVNLTKEIYVVQQSYVNVSFFLEPATNVGTGPAGGAIAAPGGTQDLTYPGQTTLEGDFDAFIPLINTTNSTNGGYLIPGNETDLVQLMNIYTDGTDTGNATAYLVPPEGLIVVSDIDDILRVTKIYEPTEGLMNSFARAFTPWMNMPEIYANWSASIEGLHQHYLTTTPEQITPNYMQYIYSTYPAGSFDTRPLNFSNIDETLSVRKYLLDKVFQTFPNRKFILVGDTTNSDVMKDYPAMVTDYPGQVQCIFLRNTSATDSGDEFPYDTSGFQGLNQQMFMFFIVPDDLKGLDIANGQCYNASIPQNLTFDTQGLPFGLGASPEAYKVSRSLVLTALTLAIAVSFGAF